MSYVLTDGSNNLVTYPYSIGLLRRDNPTVSFPASPADSLLAEWNVFPVTDVEQPSINTLTEYITEGTPVFVDNHWEQIWIVNTYTTGEAAAILARFEEDAANEAASRFEVTNKYITQSLTEGLELTPELIAYRAALMNPSALPGYPNNITWPTEPTQFFVGVGATKVASIEVENLNVTGTMVLGGSSGSVVTQEYVDDAIAAVVNSSPAALDTLNELAAALGNDANFATTVTNQIALKANSADVYTKSETDSAISIAITPKANSTDVTAALALKADASNVYTISQIDSTFNSLSKIDAGAFSSTDASIYTDSSRTPQPDPLNIGGWYFKNISAGQKINWYPYNAGTAINGSPTVEQLTSVWAVVNFYNTTTNFILAMYSKRTGTGDAGSWYKSRWIRSTKVGTIPVTTVPGTPVRMLVYFGVDPGVHPELPRLQIANTLSSNSNGTRLGTEELYTYSWGTNSASAIGTEEFTIEQFGHKLSDQVFNRSLVHIGASLSDLSAATTGLALRDKVLNLQAPVSPSTTPVIAPALATIGTTNGYVLNLSFGNFDEVGPIVFNEKWQLQVDGPPSATTTAVTIKNGITIQNSNGVRLTRVQIEGTSSISCRAGLGLHFEKVQFMGPLTLGGTGGFMMFTDAEFGGNVTISPTFAGVVYFIRCSFSGASATYTFGQTSSQQVIVMDSSGIPNTGFVSGATAKASYSGMITYKNVSQAFFVNNIPVTTAGATSGQVLKYNGTVFAPAADSATDATKLPLAGGTMSGAIAMGNNKVTGLGAPTSDADAATKSYVDTKTANVFTNAGGTIYGDLVVQDMGYTFEVNPSLGTFYMVDETGSNVEGGPGFLSVVDSATGNSSALLQGGTISLFADINANTVATPTEPQHVTTKEYVDNLVANASYLALSGGTMSGEVDMGFQKIVGLADPEWPQDAVNKQYVDTAVTSAGGGGSSNTTWNAENGSVWNIIEVSGGRTVSFTHQQDGHLGTYQILNTSTASPVTIQTTTATAELELNAVTIPFENLPILQESYLIGGTVVVNGVTYNLNGSYGYSGESGPISLGTVELVSYGVGDPVTVNITSYATDGYFVSLDGNQIAANDPLYAQHVVNSVSTVTIDGTPHTIYATDTVLGPAEGQVTFNVYFNVNAKLVPNQSVDLQLTIPEQANLWINPAIDFGVSTEELRGYSLDYHIYSQDCGTLIGKIIVAIDDNPRVTNILAASGSSDVAAIDIETYSSDWSTDKGLLFRRTDPEDDTIMIQWSGKAFYSPEWYD